MSTQYFLMVIALLVACVFGQNRMWEDEGSQMYESGPVDQRFFVPILSDKRSLNQKIRSLKERTANGQFKQILFG